MGKEPTCSPKTSLGMAKVEFITAPPILTATTPVGAKKRTTGTSGFKGPCLKVSITVWYTDLIKWLFPAPAPSDVNK